MTSTWTGSPRSRAQLTRRDVLIRGGLVGGGLCALALGGCASYGPEDAPAPGEAAAPVGQVETSAAEIPLGSGKIFADAKVVLTQPTRGNFKAFTSICTHLQCPLASVTQTINCDCHGSKFSITDGSVVHDPATAALQEFPVTVNGDRISVG